MIRPSLAAVGLVLTMSCSGEPPPADDTVQDQAADPACDSPKVKKAFWDTVDASLNWSDESRDVSEVWRWLARNVSMPKIRQVLKKGRESYSGGSARGVSYLPVRPEAVYEIGDAMFPDLGFIAPVVVQQHNWEPGNLRGASAATFFVYLAGIERSTQAVRAHIFDGWMNVCGHSQSAPDVPTYCQAVAISQESPRVFAYAIVKGSGDAGLQVTELHVNERGEAIFEADSIFNLGTGRRLSENKLCGNKAAERFPVWPTSAGL